MVAGYLRAQGSAEPEDLTSEVFLGVFRSLGKFSGSEEQFRSWVFTNSKQRHRACAAGGRTTEVEENRMIVAELLAGLSVAAKAAFGVSAAAAAVTAGGAAGVLPGPAQHAVATGVEAVTPFSFPDEANDKADFGGRVSTDARDGGVDGKAVSAEAQLQGEVSPPADAGPPADSGRPAAPGQKGLDQANTTPAASHAPTAVPGGRPSTAGTQSSAGLATAGTRSSAGLATAGSTPAAGRVPTSVPAGPPASTPPASAGTQSSTGLSTAGSTPAAGFIPASAPPARPGR